MNSSKTVLIKNCVLTRKNPENANAFDAGNDQVANGDDEANDVHNDFHHWNL